MHRVGPLRNKGFLMCAWHLFRETFEVTEGAVLRSAGLRRCCKTFRTAPCFRIARIPRITCKLRQNCYHGQQDQQ